MKAVTFTYDTDDRGRQVVFAHDPALTAVLQPQYLNRIDVMTIGYGPHEATWMLEDARACWVANMIEDGIPVPDEYAEYIGVYDWDKPVTLRRRWWWQLTFPLRRLPYALRDAAERRALRRMAR